MSFPAACNELGIALPNNTAYQSRRYQPPPSLPVKQMEWKPTTYPSTCETWQIRAGNLLADCQQRLMKNEEALRWLAGRGINGAMAALYGLGYNESSKGKDRYRPRSVWGLPEKLQNGKQKMLWIPRGWVIPCRDSEGRLSQLRIRRRDEDVAAFGQNIRYLPLDGSSQATLVLHPQAEVFFIVESGFDAILLAGIMGGRIGAICTWNSSARPDAYADMLLEQSSGILGALDYDQGGDREQAWWQGQYREYQRLPPLPGGAKDPGDAFKAGVDLRQWVIDGLPVGLRIKLGFAGTPGPVKQKAEREEALKDVEPEPDPEVVELTLTCGKTIYVTGNQDAWQQMAREGKPVFSPNELQRLKTATQGMSDEERPAAALKAVEIKEVFGGYIRAGRSLHEEMPCAILEK